MFNETLQMIASGYLVTAAVMCIRRERFRIAATAALAVFWWAAMAAWRRSKA